MVMPGAGADKRPLQVVFTAPQRKMILKHLIGVLINTNDSMISSLAEDSRFQNSHFQPVL